jgi:hypothetical protein
MDQMVVPERSARLDHPDLDVEQLVPRDVGHLSLPIDSRMMHGVVTRLVRSEVANHPFRRGRPGVSVRGDTLGHRADPAS